MMKLYSFECLFFLSQEPRKRSDRGRTRSSSTLLSREISILGRARSGTNFPRGLYLARTFAADCTARAGRAGVGRPCSLRRRDFGSANDRAARVGARNPGRDSFVNARVRTRHTRPSRYPRTRADTPRRSVARTGTRARAQIRAREWNVTRLTAAGPP